MEKMEKEKKNLTAEEKRKVKSHLRQVRRLLYRNLFEAYKGWWYWRGILKKYKKTDIKNTAIVLLPNAEKADNYLALRYLEQMLDQHGFTKAIILTHDERVQKLHHLFTDKITAVEFCPRKKAEQLIHFYCLYHIDPRFFCASINEPQGRNGSKLIGVRDLTHEEIFAVGIYKIHPFEQLQPPDYSGGEALW